MTHADAIREAERAVVEAAEVLAKAHDDALYGLVAHGSGSPGARLDGEPMVEGMVGVIRASHALSAMRERTCPACKGTGEERGVAESFSESGDAGSAMILAARCYAGCDHGAIRSTEDTRAKGE